MRKSKANRTLRWLQQYESRNVTFIDPDGSWPIVWERARGVQVRDADGKRYLDLTAAFGVAAAGHANPRVVAAAAAQMKKLLHAMGDVHPHPLKARLARELSRLTFERWSTRRPSARLTGKTLFCNSGFEAVEAALKTALLATGRPGIIAFEGAYHGLGYGALNVTFRPDFRSPFLRQLAQFGQFVPFPERAESLASLERQIRTLCAEFRIGAILTEPVQGRGGIRIPPEGFLPLLRRLADEHRALLVLDEIYTGFGRTGAWFACEHTGVIPDLVCLGKALTGGFPLSACVGRAEWMDRAWPEATGEALHTSTFLGHPAGCAMALAQLGELRRKRLIRQSAVRGRWLLARLRALPPPPGYHLAVRGIGLMTALEVMDPSGRPATRFVQLTLRRLLADGYILLPEGPEGNILSFTPPLIITAGQLERTVRALHRVWGERRVEHP